MTRHLTILSKAFYTLSAVLGLPAFAGTVFFGWAVVQIHLLAPGAVARASTKKDPDTVGDVIESTAHMVGGVLGLLGDIADAIVIGLAIGSVCLLIFAAFLLLTGRGIRAHKAWARWLGFGMAFLMGFVSLLGVFALGRGPIGAVALLLLAGSGYAIWVLLRCFGPDMAAVHQTFPNQR